MTRKTFLALIALTFFSSGLRAQSDNFLYSKAEFEEDFSFLIKNLEQTSYDWYAYQSKKDFLDFANAELEAVTNDSLTHLEAVNILQRVVAHGNMGHATIQFPVQSYMEYAYAGGTVFPLELALENEKVYIRKNFSSNENLTIGSEIVAINGLPLESILQEIRAQLAAERTYFKNALIEFWSFPRLYWQVFGKVDNFSVEVLNSEGLKTYSIPSAGIEHFEVSRQGEIIDFPRNFHFLDKAAYLYPGAFSTSETDTEDIYKAFIDSAFFEIKQSQTKNLIVDLRNNSGGDNALSDYLLSYFADTSFAWSSSFTLKTSQLLKSETRLNNDTSEAYFQAILAHEDGEKYSYKFDAVQPQSVSKRFVGNVFVLVNRQTYSMAAVAAGVVQDYGFGKIVGEETSDTPTLHAAQFSFSLPNTGIFVRVPKGYIVRPNGDESLRGVIPDIKIRDHLLDEKDEVLEGLLQILNK